MELELDLAGGVDAATAGARGGRDEQRDREDGW
jgi:hypothetical protein